MLERLRRPRSAPAASDDTAPLPLAGDDPTGPAPGTSPEIRRRSAARRRLRFLRRRRELELRDLGGLVFELQRHGEQRPQLLDAKLATIAATDRELRELEAVLADTPPWREIREAGIGGSCPSCHAIYPSDSRFCSQCGTPVAASGSPPAQTSAEGQPLVRPSATPTGEPG